MEFERQIIDRQGWVELIDVMPHPSQKVSGDLAVVNAARTSFLGHSKGEEQDKKLLFYLLRNHHTSPFEMVEFKFRIHAPVLVWWQLVRHRSANLNLQSGRYTPFKENDFYIPRSDAWRMQSTDNKQGSNDDRVSEATQTESLAYAREEYDESLGFLDYIYEFRDEDNTIRKIMQQDFYDLNYSNALAGYARLGFLLYEELLAQGVAKEQARLFLPAFALKYTGVWKMDAHNLMHFLRLRMGSDAQYEIRQYADVMYEKFFKPVLPWTAEAFEKYVLKGD